MTWEVCTVDRLSAELLVQLRTEQIAAAVVPGYCTARSAERIAALLVEHPERVNYRARWARGTEAGIRAEDRFTETDVDRVGPIDTPPEGAPQQQDPVSMIRAIRSAASPELAPIDRLRLELDEVAPLGAGLYRDGSTVRLSGVGRVMESSKQIVHADVGRRDCLTANVYLRMPGTGGGTTIWRHDGPYRQSTGSYRFADGEIPAAAPSCVVQPNVGDLVVWNPALPHMVMGFDDPPRVTLQTWLQLRHEPDAGDFSVRLLN